MEAAKRGAIVQLTPLFGGAATHWFQAKLIDIYSNYLLQRRAFMSVTFYDDRTDPTLTHFDLFLHHRGTFEALREESGLHIARAYSTDDFSEAICGVGVWVIPAVSVDEFGVDFAEIVDESDIQSQFGYEVPVNCLRHIPTDLRACFDIASDDRIQLAKTVLRSKLYALQVLAAPPKTTPVRGYDFIEDTFTDYASGVAHPDLNDAIFGNVDLLLDAQAEA